MDEFYLLCFWKSLMLKKALTENLPVFQDEKVILSDDKGSIILKNMVSVEVFRQAGYDGVMDYQLIMLDKIYEWLKEKRVSVTDGKVSIQGSDYRFPAFFLTL